MMLSCSGQSALVVSGVTTYQSSPSVRIRLADWWSGAAACQGCGQMRERGKERQQGERRCHWLLAVCTWAGQSTDQTTEHLHECCLWLSGYWYGWPWDVWGGTDHRHTVVGH